MKNRDFDRERTNRETDQDWDYYHHESRYLPDAYFRRNDFQRDYDYGTEPYNDDWTRGPFTGVGPRGYRRADDRIQDDVNNRLTWHGYIDARDIHVEVEDGVVTLSGAVDNRRQKRMAEDAAESVSGVEDVINQLHIRHMDRARDEGGMHRQIRQGMEVIGRDGDHVGEVKEVRANDFLVDRSLARDVYIPMTACRISGGQIHLGVRADEVGEQDWEVPELLETSEEKR